MEPPVRDAIQAFLEARPEVDRVFNLLTLHLGEDIMVAVKAQMRETVSAAVLVGDINATEAALRKAFPQVRWLFFEPDVAD